MKRKTILEETDDSPPAVPELTGWRESYIGVQETNLGGLTMSDFEKVLRIVKEKSFISVRLGILISIFLMENVVFLKLIFTVHKLSLKRQNYLSLLCN